MLLVAGVGLLEDVAVFNCRCEIMLNCYETTNMVPAGFKNQP